MKRMMIVGLLFVILVSEAFAYYMPSQGQWLSRDPIEEKGGNNLYGFCQNNPLIGVDPNGEFLIVSLLMGNTTANQMRSTAGVVYARILNNVGTLACTGLYGISKLAELGGAGVEMAYKATEKILYANPNLAYNSGSFFTQAMGWSPGPTPNELWAVRGAAVNIIFSEWMEYVVDPDTP